MDITYEQISGSLGSLLLVWASLEKSVRAEILSTNGTRAKTAHGLAAALNTWEKDVLGVQPTTSLGPLLASALRRQLQSPLNIRNGLCHGLRGISAAIKGKPAALCWETNDEERSISWDDLQQQLSWLSRLPRAVSIISNPRFENPGNRAADTPENRDWWRSEFGIDLPER